MELNLQDKVVIVTGASRGLGKAISKYLVGEVSVVAVVRSQDDLNKLQQSNFEKIHPVVCDMAKKEEVES